MKAIYFCKDKSQIINVYAAQLHEKLTDYYDINRTVYDNDDIGKIDFSDVEAIYSTWGMPSLGKEDIKTYFPSLKFVYYAAGTVQGFARPFLELGIKVFSAWQANAVPVVEYAVSQIILANKGFFAMSSECKADYRQSRKLLSKYKGNYGAKVGILGDGAIGSSVIKKLKELNLDVMVFSITMTDEQALKTGVKKASLAEIFEQCDVISNHLANNAQTKGIISKELINMMHPYSTFINTGRGAQVDEQALIEKLISDPTIFAVLDVTDPEPPEKDSRLNSLKNVILTPHIAGSNGNEVCRMAEYMISETERYFKGEEQLYEVTLKMLETMA